MKNNADALIFHTTICAEAPQIVLMHRAKTAMLLFARASSACASEWRILCLVRTSCIQRPLWIIL